MKLQALIGKRPEMYFRALQNIYIKYLVSVTSSFICYTGMLSGHADTLPNHFSFRF